MSIDFSLMQMLLHNLRTDISIFSDRARGALSERQVVMAIKGMHHVILESDLKEAITFAKSHKNYKFLVCDALQGWYNIDCAMMGCLSVSESETLIAKLRDDHLSIVTCKTNTEEELQAIVMNQKVDSKSNKGGGKMPEKWRVAISTEEKKKVLNDCEREIKEGKPVYLLYCGLQIKANNGVNLPFQCVDMKSLDIDKTNWQGELNMQYLDGKFTIDRAYYPSLADWEVAIYIDRVPEIVPAYAINVPELALRNKWQFHTHYRRHDYHKLTCLRTSSAAYRNDILELSRKADIALMRGGSGVCKPTIRLAGLFFGRYMGRECYFIIQRRVFNIDVSGVSWYERHGLQGDFENEPLSAELQKRLDKLVEADLDELKKKR